MSAGRSITPASGLGHLAARLADVVLSRRLTPLEQAEVAAYLRTSTERAMFWGQPTADQRHGLQAARSVGAARPDRSDLIRAALLHDAGKRHARLGPLRRSWAVLRTATGMKPTSRLSSYLDHSKLGADELEEAGAEPLIVAYTLHHHGERPGSISLEDWEVLVTADRSFLPKFPSLTYRPRRSGYASLPRLHGNPESASAEDGHT